MGRKFSDSESHYKSTQNADVLVVEDNKINRSIIVSLLEKIGLNCAEAENGEDAINIVREKGPESFQLIFMDLQMPVMDGLTASKKLLETYPAQPLKIIAVTANAFEEDKDTCLNIGMVDFISKPFKIKDLENVVKKHSTPK
jgi:CheY-like chemotaxis protein